MRSARELKLHVYKFTSDSLRGQHGLRHLAGLIGVTKDGDLKRLQAQMVKLADALDKKRAAFVSRDPEKSGTDVVDGIRRAGL